ncbi:MAG: cytochrome bc complex cytochrome b subunit [Deltaproteobacteria bacterium]|nr:cytochrome bc complex cytochrome b subunit [Deltaproteobacteria bacterium]
MAESSPGRDDPGWLRERTGIGAWLDRARKLQVPGGIRSWAAHVGGVAILLLVVQTLTGILLLVHYRAGDGAWASVARITSQIPFGWLVRGTHSIASHLLVLLVLAHLLSSFASRAFRRPRELTWMTGVALLACVLGLGLSGTVLVGDQRALFTARVALHMTRALPWVGSFLAGLLGGGPDVGTETGQRMLAVHAGALPLALLCLAAMHLWLVRTHGLCAPARPRANPIPWYPDFLSREATLWVVASILLVAAAALWPPEVGRSADPLEPTPHGIRPAWFFLPLYQLLRMLPPMVAVVRGEQVAWIAVLLVAAGVLTLPLWEDGERRWAKRVADLLAWILLPLLLGLGLWGWTSS